MRNLLRRVGVRTGVSLGLIVVIAGILTVAHLLDDRRSDPFPRPPEYTPGVVDTMGDDGADDDQPTAFRDDAAVLSVAVAFTGAWLSADVTAREWLEGMRPHATDALIGRLADVDPSEVPAGATAGEPTIRDRTEGHAIVVVPIATHDALVLGLVATDKGWRVATLDRETG